MQDSLESKQGSKANSLGSLVKYEDCTMVKLVSNLEKSGCSLDWWVSMLERLVNRLVKLVSTLVKSDCSLDSLGSTLGSMVNIQSHHKLDYLVSTLMADTLVIDHLVRIRHANMVKVQ